VFVCVCVCMCVCLYAFVCVFDQTLKKNKPLLPDLMNDSLNRPQRTLVVEMDDVLIKTEWDRTLGWQFKFRPGFVWFLWRLQQAGYEVVMWTQHPQYIGERLVAETQKSAPVPLFTHTLFKEAGTFEGTDFVKDLSRLNRDLSRVIVLDTHKTLVTLPGQKDNVLQIKRFRGDADDSQLFQIMAFLERTHASIDRPGSRTRNRKRRRAEVVVVQARELFWKG
jgi:import inner membrane translocase subunit TIM50